MTTSVTTEFCHDACILVVEDSDEDFETLVEAARGAGITQTIHRAVSGGDCLALLRGQSETVGAHLPGVPALVLMDLNSHGVDGREALVEIKSDAELKSIPVVVFTTSANPRDLTVCYQAGANAYHVKPVRHDKYRSLVRALLHYWLNTVTPSATALKVD